MALPKTPQNRQVQLYVVQLAHNKQNPCSPNVGGLLPPPFCSSLHHCIALVYAKTQGPNAHLAPVLEFLLDFQCKNSLNEVTCLQLFRNLSILTCTIDFFGCSIKKLPVKSISRFPLSRFYLKLFKIFNVFNYF